MNLSFFTANAEYCNFLRKHDSCVPYTMDSKQSRPFVGVVFKVHDIHYYAPLTSPKPKHARMKNQIDFLKINGGEFGAINFNNMIPIHESCLKKVDVKINLTDSKSALDYKNLMVNQLTWCNANKERIIDQAAKLHNLIINKRLPTNIINRCCNFQLNERQYKIYCEENRLSAGKSSISLKERMAAAVNEADRQESNLEKESKIQKEIDR